MASRTPNHAGQGKPQRIWKRIFATLLAIMVTTAVCFAFWSLREMSKIARLASCRPYSIAWVASDFSKNYGGLFPPLSAEPGRLMLDVDAGRPYMWGMNEYICEFDKQGRAESEAPGATINDWSYVYLGYVIENQAQLELFAEAYMRIVAQKGDFTQDIKVASGQGNCGTDTLHRMRSQDDLLEILPCLRGRLDRIPLVIEWPENHRGPVAKVVSLAPKSRGDVMPYPGEWPMTEAAIGVLRELDALGAGESTESNAR